MLIARLFQIGPESKEINGHHDPDQNSEHGCEPPVGGGGGGQTNLGYISLEEQTSS